MFHLLILSLQDIVRSFSVPSTPSQVWIEVEEFATGIVPGKKMVLLK
jgi:hypothetical protein